MQSYLLVFFLGYGIGYDGCEENKIYFHVNTPSADYGFIVQDKEPVIYCDIISIKEKK